MKIIKWKLKLKEAHFPIIELGIFSDRYYISYGCDEGHKIKILRGIIPIYDENN